MKILIAAVVAALSIGAAHAQPAQKTAAECGAEKPGKYMNMSPKEFDQTLDEGWREIGDQEGCERAGADLIAMYRDEKLAQDIAGLDWHEAQLRAAAGEIDAAIVLFERNLVFRRTQVEGFGHNTDVLYGEATIAFLRGDRATLEAKRAQMAVVPKPDWFDALVADYATRAPKAGVPIWPMNLDVVDGFIACFGRPYREAYSSECRPERAE